MTLEFEWDPDKAASNQKKHQVTFEEAATVFADSNKDRLLLVSFTERAQVILDH